MKLLTLLLFASLVAVSCAPARFVEPLPRDHYAATASLGGPLITFDSLVIPMPLTSLAAGYGVTDKTTLFGGLHTTALLFKDLQLDLGALHELSAQDKWLPAISVAPVLNIVLAFRDNAFKIWPEADVNFYWHYLNASGNLIYLSSQNWFELSSTRADYSAQTRHWFANFALGHTFDGEHWQYVTELKYLEAGVPNLPGPVDYHGISGNGAFGVYLALTRKF
ncbi:MAG: hypothetical protein Q8922_06350 [Bacteroidota bacterium]|nr:hypothetical protein [Bacteroidota bacterium]MDP4233779.1 hypothetical protein [Bacteroidota bacterium]MDP4242418.1 hypothetical protein [Bacteroidota bacterium]MDP4287540.1 hypothetical protein [Bacteroidota bacterium]